MIIYLIMPGVSDIDPIDLDNLVSNPQFAVSHGSSIVRDLGDIQTVRSFLVRSGSKSSCDGEPESSLVSEQRGVNLLHLDNEVFTFLHLIYFD